jgi:GntR family transcriptional regulator, transcriptional repressor for pyruvate dehydrogenase complex
MSACPTVRQGEYLPLLEARQRDSLAARRQGGYICASTLSDDQTPAPILALRQPIERRNTYELVAESLLALISERHLKPGDTLPTERELMQHYGVGRSSVREALRMLESRGLISAGGSGAFAVADFRNPLNDSLSLLLAVEEGSLRELFEVRRIVEGEAVALATERGEEVHLDRMRAATELMREGLGNRDEYIEADVAFHLTIAEATQNRMILHLMHAIRDQLERALGSIYKIPGSPERSIEDHGLIIEAMEAGKPDEARERMREHLARVEEAVEAATAKSSRAPRS